MDFHSLSRKELQVLCKNNKIPANMTNVAMADALKALEKVEGLDELINPTKNDAQQFPENTTIAEPRTAARTSTRRKPINVEPESSQPLTRTRRTTRRTVAEEAEQENQNVNLLETPAMPTIRKGAPAASARRKIDVQLMENEEDEKSNVPETPEMQSSRRKAPAVSTKKNEKSVQRVYGTRQSVRLLEKGLAELSLKEKRGIEAVKIEGLGEETEEVEQNEDVPAGDSEVLSCQDKDISLENESEMKLKVQEDNKSNGHEADESEVLSSQNLDQLLENESETKHEIQEEKNTNDHEVDESFVLVQNLDESLDNECEMKHELDVDNKRVDHEGQSDVLCQEKDQLIKSGSAEKLGLQVDNEINDNEMIDCNLTLEMGSKYCTNLDNLLDANDNDCSDGSFSLQEETSEKAIDINCESINGPNVIIAEHSETLNADLNPKIVKEMNDNQDYFIVEAADDNSAFVMETENISVDVIDSLTLKESEVMGKISEMNLIEDGGDDLHSKAATEEISNGNALDEVPDDSESDEVPDDSESDEVPDGSESDEVSDETESDSELDEVPDDSELDEVPDDSELDEVPDDSELDDVPDDSELDEVSDDSESESELDEVPDDSELDEVSDGSEHFIVSDGSVSVEVSDVIVEVSDGSISNEVQENDDTGKIQKAPLLPEADYGNSHGRNEPESPRFHLQHEKCKEASDHLVNECMTDNVSVIEAKESDSDKTPRSPTSLKQISPYQPLVSGDKVTDGMVSSPFAANTIQGQFPRPTEPTPRKSSTKKPTTIQKIIDPDIINKENIDNSGRKVEAKKDKVKKNIVNANMSRRQLSKMLKKKLIIANKKNDEEKNVAKGGNRLALQKVPENFTAATETEHKN